ncbi:autophagy-related protein 11-domain-containing protein [Phascolomyces articulosus]|uniref:Autophagy-related protein 11 n=1 Tax=Phascolomyces articulosus TaxID=60185 RepID=A0AAD5KAV0_9FUNG|nr:autophagy-related protein 11-domain-containing protein [Phascolomyces articulosus]
MVARAESDWMNKHQALEEILQQRRNTHNALIALVMKYNRPINLSIGEEDIQILLDMLKESLDTFATEASTTKQKLMTIEQEHGQLISRMNSFDEERAELYSTATQMAEKLEEFRKGLFYELTHQLQLSVDEEEAKAMTKKLMISGEHDDLTVWARVLQAVGTVDSAKFVERIRSKVRDAHELTRRWKREYKDLRDKYNKVSGSSHDKIAFRNFQVGDVALFLPTRNSTGKPWAAFNINAPHYFLKPSNSVAQQMNSREWLVARITSITEHTVNGADPQSNPYGLTEGLTYYHLEVENWKTNRHRKSHQSKKSTKSSTSSPSTKGKEPENVASSSAFTKNYTTTTPDTGLASISSPDTQRHSTNEHNISSVAMASTASSSNHHHPRPPFPPSLSSSSVVHSYIPPNSPPMSVSERRHSIGFFTPQSQQQQQQQQLQQQQQDNLSRSQQSLMDSTMMWTHTDQ